MEPPKSVEDIPAVREVMLPTRFCIDGPFHMLFASLYWNGRVRGGAMQVVVHGRREGSDAGGAEMSVRRVWLDMGMKFVWVEKVRRLR